MDRLQNAIDNNNFVELKVALREGVNPNQHIDEDLSPLMYAIQKRVDIELIECLIENGANIKFQTQEGVNLLDEAISTKRLDLIKKLINLGLRVDTPTRKSGFTPLMLATSLNSVEIVKFLLENGAKVDSIDNSGLKAIDYARKMQSKKVLELLKKF